MLKRKKITPKNTSDNFITFKASRVINGYGGGCILEGKYSVFRPDCRPRIPG